MKAKTGIKSKNGETKANIMEQKRKQQDSLVLQNINVHQKGSQNILQKKERATGLCGPPTGAHP
jgi:hypothetical protein